LAKATWQYRSFLLDITKDPKRAMVYGPIKFADITNTDNPFINDARYLGGLITKGTSGQQTVMALYELDFKGAKRPIVILSLNTASPVEDVRAMLNYIDRVYR
jgi:hypothetical protein